MITTNTGAKKLESSDNWREIFPNPGTGTAGAHNATVDAQDRIQAEVAPIINGKQCALGASAGDYVLLRNSTIIGKSDGAYIATKAIPANTDLDSTYLGNAITGGISNSLNSKITELINTTINTPYDEANSIPCRFRQWGKIGMISIEYTAPRVNFSAGGEYTICTLPSGSRPSSTMYLSMMLAEYNSNTDPIACRLSINASGAVELMPRKAISTSQIVFGEVTFPII